MKRSEHGRLKTASTLLAVLLQSLSLTAQAEEYFIGGDIAPIVSWAEKCTLLVFGCSWSDNTHGYGVRVGRWMQEGDAGISGVGWELGYDDLGAVNLDINASEEIWNFFAAHTLAHDPH